MGEGERLDRMSKHLVRIFPNLAGSPWRTTSPADTTYNCIAWALGETQRWWWPDPLGQYYWPQNAQRESTLEAMREVLVAAGYMECLDGSYEEGFEKVAIYLHQGVLSHAARQIPTGAWTSKLGYLEDIEHQPQALAGSAYGDVALYMKRHQG